MDLAGYLVRAVLLEGRSVAEVARTHDVSRSWLYELLARYKEKGEAALTPGSRRPHSSPTRIGAAIEDEIVKLRKELSAEGLDAGAETIRYHLLQSHRRRKKEVPSVATIWRVLSRRGFVTRQPHKRPKSSYKRFCAELPNECWQMDTTHVILRDGSDVEVLNVLDDHSRLLVASVAFLTTKAADVVTTFRAGAERYGYPAAVLSDNGAIFTAESRNGRCVMENELASLGIAYKHSRPYHPETCGKVERFHQTMKKHLYAKRRARTLAELQRQLDAFTAYYNDIRPHRAIGRRTPAQAFAARTKATPKLAPVAVGDYRVRRDRIDQAGKVTLRYRSKLHHIGVGRAHAGKRVLLLVVDRDVRVVSEEEGELLGKLTLDPFKNYQPVERA